MTKTSTNATNIFRHQTTQFHVSEAFGDFDLHVPGRKFIGLRRLALLQESSKESILTALVVFNDILFFAVPDTAAAGNADAGSGSGGGGGVLSAIHLPVQRNLVTASVERDMDGKVLSVELPDHSCYLFRTTSAAECNFWVRAINSPEGFVPTAELREG